MKRRDFISRTASASLFAPFFFNAWRQSHPQSPITPFTSGSIPPDRILVYIWMYGGNDGLNTIVPFNDPVYIQKRPNVRIKNPLPLTNTLGWHPALAPLKALYDDGKVAIIENVGYEDPVFENPRSAEIWYSASNSNQYLNDGWLGRFLSYVYPDFPMEIPMQDHLPSLGFNVLRILSLQGPEHFMGMYIPSIDQLYQVAQGSDLSGFEQPPPTCAGEQLAYVQSLAVQLQHYTAELRRMYNSQSSPVTYPPFGFSTNLKTIARLIAAGNKTPVYFVQLNGFATWTNQVNSNDSSTGIHATLLKQFADSISAFLQDLKLHNVDDKVLIVTGSEFGRSVTETGALGTDNGTAAPHFVIGNKVIPSIIGHDPNLNDLISNKYLKREFDFRQLYASILEQWFCTPRDVVRSLLYGDFATLPLTSCSLVNEVRETAPDDFALEQNYPNPFVEQTSIGFRLPNPASVKLSVYNSDGKFLRSLVNDPVSAGRHEIIFDANSLPSGTYFYRMECGGKTISRTMVMMK